MSDEPRKVWVKAVPQLLGIAVLAALLLAGVRRERAPEKSLSRLQQAARRLRVDMTAPEAREETKFVNDLSLCVYGTSHSRGVVFFDPRRREFLTLHFVTKHNPPTGRYESLLVDWNASKP